MSFVAGSLAQTTEPAAPEKLPPERTYNKQPFIHRIPLLDAEGNTIRSPKPDDPADARPAMFSLQHTCGKCHSDYPTIAGGWHFNYSDPNAPHGRPGEPWLLTDLQTRTQLPLSYRGWAGTFHPYDVGINDFAFARLFARHHPGGGAMAESKDVRFKASGLLQIDCLICHTTDGRHDPVARAEAISGEENYAVAPALAAFLGQVTGSAARLKDDFDPAGRDARRAPRVTYDWARFDAKDRVLFNVSRNVPNERCYVCHTNIDVGASKATNEGLESRWRHAGDVHLIKGMRCVDCHRNGADHMIVRGYEGEYDVRLKALGSTRLSSSQAAEGSNVDKSITTLSCRGCHYGSESGGGGIGAAPRPIHRGLPTLHFDKLTCTACHSGPLPSAAATAVQTAMAHKLGLPRHHTADGAAPTIQQPVFLRVDKLGNVLTGHADDHESAGALAPHRMVHPAFWGRMNGDETITPIQPKDVLAAGAGDILGAAPDAKHHVPFAPLTNEQVAAVLGKLAAAQPPEIPPAEVVTARAPTTAPTTGPTTNAAAPAWASGEPVYVTGGKAYKRTADGKSIEAFAHKAAEPYAWPLAHDVRPAAQSLGARGCVECHSSGGEVFHSTVNSAALITGAARNTPMHAMNGQPVGALAAFATTYPLRPILIVAGYAAAAVLGLVLLSGAVRAIGRGAR